jgi:hypothetical protein
VRLSQLCGVITEFLLLLYLKLFSVVSMVTNEVFFSVASEVVTEIFFSNEIFFSCKCGCK